jgi:hypothetical protein
VIALEGKENFEVLPVFICVGATPRRRMGERRYNSTSLVIGFLVPESSKLHAPARWQQEMGIILKSILSTLGWKEVDLVLNRVQWSLLMNREMNLKALQRAGSSVTICAHN